MTDREADLGGTRNDGGQRSIAPIDMARFIRIAREEGGFSISPERTGFVASRLAGELERLELPDFSAYAAFIEGNPCAEARRRFVEALATHTTSFFRETGQYDWLHNTGLPALLGEHGRSRGELTVWSAACSSGQELFSALMTIESHANERRICLRARGIGTDISATVLARARDAVYTREEVAGIPVEMRPAVLLSARSDPDRFRIVSRLREQTRWIQANLTREHTLPSVTADIVLLRNVLIYFDTETRERVLSSVTRRLARGGYLLTGHAETIRPERFGLEPVRPSIYRRPR